MMKTMLKPRGIHVLLGLWIMVGLAGGQALAQQSVPGVKVSVALDRPAYLLQTTSSPGDPIKIAVTLENVSGGTVLASHGFTTQPLALLLVFTDPAGQLITATQQSLPHEGGPPPVLPVDGVLVQVDPLDTLASTFVLSVTIPDARTFYPFTKAGFYTVKASVPIRTYPAIFRTVAGVDYAQLDTANFGGSIDSAAAKFALVADADQDNYSYPVPLAPYNTTAADCNDANPAVHPGATEISNNGIDDDCNPATPDVVVVAPATINVTAAKHTVGSGSNPTVKKDPLPNMPVHVFESGSGSCASRLGTRSKDFKSVWLSCTPKYLSITKADGTASLAVSPGSYLVLGEYDPNGVAQSGDELYDGGTTGALASGSRVQETMRFIVKSNGKAVPAQTTQLTGSLLLIIQPAYVEWDGAQELYPFIFESVGDWTVTTSVAPPPGFVADNPSLTAVVNTDLKSTQFTLTDVGSEWTHTGVTHTIKHKGKTEKITSKIEVRLSEQLAKAKGLTRLGVKKK